MLTGTGGAMVEFRRIRILRAIATTEGEGRGWATQGTRLRLRPGMNSCKEEDNEEQEERDEVGWSGDTLSFPFGDPREGKNGWGAPTRPCPGADLYVVLGISTSLSSILELGVGKPTCT
ncbi:hypothetical protein NLI96_g8646 [Meripilus lineatus]|uniref:Uncharacterized protein n=1 Tax=Meripilus lineatus TaxID=2056292 RepID=A0AAD5UX83_9APHY|nr:hypothetical protein NLI96_g8646 [Physisporinus lineatus]